MTREEAEDKILQHLRDIEMLRREFCPDDDYISLAICNGWFHANNTASFDPRVDQTRKISFSVEVTS